MPTASATATRATSRSRLNFRASSRSHINGSPLRAYARAIPVALSDLRSVRLMLATDALTLATPGGQKLEDEFRSLPPHHPAHAMRRSAGSFHHARHLARQPGIGNELPISTAYRAGRGSARVGTGGTLDNAQSGIFILSVDTGATTAIRERLGSDRLGTFDLVVFDECMLDYAGQPIYKPRLPLRGTVISLTDTHHVVYTDSSSRYIIALLPSRTSTRLHSLP